MMTLISRVVLFSHLSFPRFDTPFAADNRYPMRTLILWAMLAFPVLFLGSALAEENQQDRELCLTLLPWVVHLRKDLVGPLDLKNAVGSGLSVVAHTRRKEALNCVFRYDKPAHTYIHLLFFFESERLFAVRLAPTDAGSIDMKTRRSK